MWIKPKNLSLQSSGYERFFKPLSSPPSIKKCGIRHSTHFIHIVGWLVAMQQFWQPMGLEKSTQNKVTSNSFNKLCVYFILKRNSLVFSFKKKKIPCTDTKWIFLNNIMQKFTGYFSITLWVSMSIPSPALKFFSHNNNKEKFDEFLIK